MIREYEKIINLLDDTPNHPFKYRATNCVEINSAACGIYDTNSQIKFLFDYSDAFILVKGTMTIIKGAAGEQKKEIKTK